MPAERLQVGRGFEQLRLFENNSYVLQNLISFHRTGETTGIVRSKEIISIFAIREDYLKHELI